MRKIFIVFFLFLNGSLIYSQKSQVLHPSGFAHNYLIGRLTFIEDKKDTIRLKYVAHLRITKTDNSEEMPLQNFMQVKAKELGADCYYLVGHSETQNSLEVIIKLFFGGEKFLKDNEKKQQVNRIVIFNETRVVGDTAVFYLNGKREVFDPLTIYTKALAVKETCLIGINQDRLTTTKVVFKKPKKARFFILPENKKSILFGQPRYAGIRVNAFLISVRVNSLHEMNYDSGRFWLDFYK